MVDKEEQGEDVAEYEESEERIFAKGTKRNFPQVQKNVYYSLEDIRWGDEAGTTETDSKTHPKGSGGYSTINQTSGKGIR